MMDKIVFPPNEHPTTDNIFTDYNLTVPVMSLDRIKLSVKNTIIVPSVGLIYSL